MALLVRLMAAVIVFFPAWTVSAQGESIEDDVKAAFLYNFTKYVDWPSSAFQDSSDSFRMCVAASPKFVRTVETLITGETARGRPIKLVTPELANVHRCHVLFTGAREVSRFDGALRSLSGRPILTIGESQALFDQGAAILLVVDDRRVRFDIDVRAIEKAGLTVSSKLLRVARNVREEPAR